jgi:hypothetical protein
MPWIAVITSADVTGWAKLRRSKENSARRAVTTRSNTDTGSRRSSASTRADTRKDLARYEATWNRTLGSRIDPMASSRLPNRSESSDTSAPSGPAIVTCAVKRSPAHRAVAWAFTIPAKARAKSSKSRSDTIRSRVSTVSGAFVLASSSRSGAAPPPLATGLVTPRIPRGRVCSSVRVSASRFPSGPSPDR